MAEKKKIWILVAFTAFAVLLVIMLPPVRQAQAYHNLADHRSWLGIPNAANVLSNIPFFAIGLAGMSLSLRSHAHTAILRSWRALFAGIFLTGFGSAWYHWHPDNNSLVWDRIPMTVVFMALLSAVVGEIVSRKAGTILLWPLICFGIASVLYWHWGDLKGKGDLRPYGLVQFYPVACIPLILALFYGRTSMRDYKALGWVVAWYIIAKVLEVCDEPVFRALGISGHTLKHLAAAISTWYLVVMFREKYTKKNAPQLS